MSPVVWAKVRPPSTTPLSAQILLRPRDELGELIETRVGAGRGNSMNTDDTEDRPDYTEAISDEERPATENKGVRVEGFSRMEPPRKAVPLISCR